MPVTANNPDMLHAVIAQLSAYNTEVILQTEIHLYSHHFVVVKPDPAIIPVLYGIAADYTRFSMQWCPKRKKNAWLPEKTYALCVGQLAEFRFHIGQYVHIEEQFRRGFLRPDHYNIIKHDAPEGDDVELKVKEGWVLREDQTSASEFILNSPSDQKTPLLSMPTGSGKHLNLETPIKVPGGWKLMGDIHVGDWLTAWDGKPSQVIGVYPQGVMLLYWITFDDGRSVECGLDHLWRVYSKQAEHGEVIDTETIKQRLLDKRGLYIDLISPEDCEDKLLDIDPYILGYGISSGGVKDIPEDYLEGSYHQRLSLIQGVLDASGRSDKRSIHVSIASETLAKSIVYLTRSLGGKAWHVKQDNDYDITIIHKTPSLLFRDVKQPSLSEYHDLKLRIVNVKFSRTAEAQCIAIDHPDKLYVVNDFIVTHNTVTSLVTASKIGKRLAVFVLGRYMDKWVEDIQKTYDITKKEICVIRGNNALMDASHWVSGGTLKSRDELPKVFIISINTISVWAKHYCENPEDPTLQAYGCQLFDFINELGVGTVIFDEVHQHLYAVYRILCFLNVNWAISLSATLLSKDMIIERVQHAMFPRHARFEEIKMEQYINCYAVSYQIKNFTNSRIQISDYGSTRYSHTAYETSILRHRQIGKQYIDMIVKLVKETYHTRYMKQDKCIVFVAMGVTADTVRKAIRADPDLRRYDTRTYLESDPYENAMEPDIIVSTVLSAGTALDIPNLRVAIMTISVDSPVANLQTLGRLRKLKDRDVHFYYLFCSSIPKHTEYHQNKVTLFKHRVACHKQILLPHLN